MRYVSRAKHTITSLSLVSDFTHFNQKFPFQHIPHLILGKVGVKCRSPFFNTTGFKNVQITIGVLSRYLRHKGVSIKQRNGMIESVLTRIDFKTFVYPVIL